MHNHISRRELLSGLGAAAASLAIPVSARAEAPASPVAVARCRSYDPSMTEALNRMFDQLGGLGRLVKGKTVAIKINMTGESNQRVGHVPAELAHWTHPGMVGAIAHLMGRAGARRIRVVECGYCTSEPLEEVMLRANWDPQVILGAAPHVEFENTNWLGNAKRYSQLKTPGGGYMFSSFDLNHSYEECDVFVSVAKMKEHATCGVTLSMKNCFGITPCTIYGDGAGGKDAPLLAPQGGRTMLHSGSHTPVGHKENDPKAPHEGGYRVPRIVADLIATRPIHLAIVDGISTVSGGEGPWIFRSRVITPGLLVAGTNAVCTDAVSVALMGYDPSLARGTAPFQRCDNHLLLAQEKGLGTTDLKRIEVLGTPISEAVFPFRQKV